MKKILLINLLFFSSFCFSQKTLTEYKRVKSKTKEIKVNAFSVIALKWIDASYEQIIDEESSFGTSFAINLDKSIATLNYSVTPYYRRFFSNGNAKGFFVEGFGMLYSADLENTYNQTLKENTETAFGIGISAGGKFISKNGFTTEILFGIGRTLLTNKTTSKNNFNSENEMVGRLGISLGYRF